MNDTEMHVHGRAPAVLWATQIGDFANKSNPSNPMQYAGFLACLVLQNIAISVLMNNFTPGSTGGEECLEKIYSAALRDAKVRWHKDDLKKNAHHFQNPSDKQS